MFGYDKLDLSLSLSATYFFIALLLLLSYSVYVYRYTLPPLPKFKKIILTFLRFTSLLLLLFIFFEPVLTLTTKNMISPVSLFFFDNSKSISIEDRTDRKNTMRLIAANTINNSIADNSEINLFSSSVKLSSKDSLLNNLNFSGSTTNFSEIFNHIKKSEKNISSITIISDGVLTEGSTPALAAEKLSIPVFTVGIGDSTLKNDVEIKNVNYNELIYKETPTTILATLVNRGYAEKPATISLLENNNLLEQRNITLDKSGINSVEFTYTPKTSGEKKLTISISRLEGEASFFNNQQNIYLNVIDNKINILLLAGSPSSDLSFIKSTLEADENLFVNTLTEITANTFLENNSNTKLDSAQIIFLIGYPTNKSSNEFFERLINKIEKQNTPVFILLTSDVSNQKLTRLNNFLPVNIQNVENNFLQIQPDIQTAENKHPILQGNQSGDWNNLPPVFQAFGNYTAKPESKIISKVKVNGVPRNIPFIVTRSFGSKRSIIIIGQDIWRWKLQMTSKAPLLFDNFILNVVRWLNSPEKDKRVRIATSKKSYSTGEVVEFFAQVYDESLNPVNDANLIIKISSTGFTTEFSLNNVGNGLYEGKININKVGDYSFSGAANIDSKLLGEDKGIFNIGDTEIEFIESRMNKQFLSLLSSVTNGKYFNPEQYQDLLSELNRLNQITSKEKITRSELRLWSYEWLLVIVILLFSLEWFLRKRNGML